MALKPSLIRNAIGVRMDRPATVDEAIAALGGGTRGRVALAQQLAGTTNKKSKEYKSALRNLQRWTTTTRSHRAPTKSMPRIRAKLTTVVEKHRAQLLADRLRGPITVIWEAPVVQYSATEEERPDIEESIPDSYLDEFRAALAEGDEREAANALARATAAVWFEVPYGQAPATITEAAGLTIQGLS